MGAVPRRWLIIHPGALGDVLLALPALAHLARLFPGADRILAAAPRVGALLDGSAYIEASVDFDTLGLHRLFAVEADPVVLDRLAPYQGVVSWFGAGDPTYCAHLAALGGWALVARATPPAGSSVHAARHLLATLAPLGPAPDALPPLRLTAGDAERRWARAWLEARDLSAHEVLMLHPGAGSPAKIWPGFGALARRFVAAGAPVVVVSGPADAVPVAQVVESGDVRETMVVRELSLRRLAALVQAARAFVGNDSGLSHLAAALGCPSLVLFGPTDPAVWAPSGERVVVLAGAGSGAPDPWDGLSVDRVEAALAGLLRGPRAIAGWASPTERGERHA